MTRILTFSIALIAISLIYCLGTPHALAREGMSSDTSKALAQARRATARYHNIDNARADMYTDASFVLPGVGCHLINPSLIDGEFDPTQPELLIYSDNCGDEDTGRATLRSVEYVIPCAERYCPNTDLPEGFPGDADWWEYFEGPGGQPPYLWTLHAWIWRHNPEGIFVKINPRLLP
jgi:hypothetical protein